MPLDLLFFFFFIYTRIICDQRTTLLCEWWLLVTSHYPVKFSSSRLHGNKNITKLICHVYWPNRKNMWSKAYVALWLGMWLLIISHRSVNFDSDRSRESEFETFSICHVTLCDHAINRLSDLMDNKHALEPTTLSSFAAIGLQKVEI